MNWVGIAEILLSKLQTLDRDNVEKLLYDCVKKNPEEYPIKEVLEEYAGEICQLIPQQPTKTEIRSIVAGLIADVLHVVRDEGGLTELAKLLPPVVKELSNLYKGEK